MSGDKLGDDRLALSGELLADARHECNNQLAFILSNLQNLVEYGDALARVIGEYRDRVRGAGLADPELAALEAEVDLDFLLEDAGRAAREGLAGATRLREILTVVARVGEDQGKEQPLVEISRIVKQVLGIQAKPIGVHAKLDADLGLEANVAAPPAVLTRALVVMLKHALARLDPDARATNRLRIALERRADQVGLVVERQGAALEAGTRGLELAHAAAATIGGEVVEEEGRVTLVVPEAQ